MAEVMLGSLGRIILEEYFSIRVGVDINEPWTDEQPVGVNDMFAMFRDGEIFFSAEGLDDTVFQKHDGLGNQMVTHDQNGVFNSDHKKCTSSDFSFLGDDSQGMFVTAVIP